MKTVPMLFLLLMIFLLGSCGGTIEVVNQSNYTGSMEKISVYPDGDSSITSYSIQANGGILLTGYRSNWKWSSIERFSQEMDILILMSASDTIILDSQEKIREHLRNNRKGIFNQKIRLNVPQ